MAVNYLKKAGYEILARNYLIKSGEIDIIAKKDGIVAAIEVKYRSSTRYGTPFTAVTKTKQKSISKTFMHYLFANKLSFDEPYRFDVLSITADERVEHLENAFDFIT